MTIRSVTLLASFLVLAYLPGCGTDTKMTTEIGGSGFTANHFDSTDTANVIEGYVIKKDSSGALVCGDCHKEDRSDVAINRQWAASAHAGHILTAGVVQDGATKNSPWAHYDWDSISRQSCQQCHTSTGQANFMKSQWEDATSYNNKKNDFTHLSGWVGTKNGSGEFTSVTSSNQNEMLYCWGCHSDVETGTLHAPVSVGIKPGYKVDDVALQLPNLGSSNACVGCHSGRGNIQILLKANGVDPTTPLSADTTPKSTATATATHYLNAAATIFHEETKVGYEFPELNYTDPAKYGDQQISYLHRFSNCVACHMSGEESHSFSATQKDTVTGEITAINSQKVCNGCHSSLIPMNAGKLEESRKGYEESLHILEHELALHGYVFVNAHPYFYVGSTAGADLFFKSPNGITPAVFSETAIDRNGDLVVDTLDWNDVNLDGIIDDADLVMQPVTWKTQGDIGSGHNFNYLHHEPGAFAHNRFYAKRLIFDSIDWLDDGKMDNKITIDADYPNARVWLNADATGIATRP